MKQKSKLRITEYHVLIFSAIVFIVQYSLFSVNTINFPKWIYLVLIFVALLVNVLVKTFKGKIEFNLATLLRVFKSFIAYMFLILSISLLSFGIANKTYSQKEELLCMELKIVSAFEKTSRSSNRIYFELDGKKYGITVPSSPEVSNLIKNKDILIKSYLLLECRKGLVGTYIIENKEIITK